MYSISDFSNEGNLLLKSLLSSKNLFPNLGQLKKAVSTSILIASKNR